MASQFINDMIINLRAFNPSLSQIHARHMVLSGLQGTNYWDRLSTDDQEAALNTINESRCTGAASRPDSSFNFKDC